MKIDIVISLHPELMEKLFGGNPCQNVVERNLDYIINQLEDIKRMTAETQELLNQIDETTNAIAANVGTIGTVTSTISTEMDTLIAQTSDTDLKAKLTDFSSRLSAVAGAASSQVEVLNAIAAKGAPVAPPPPNVVTAA